ncbi:MAG TPA: LuxR C-terminal-related transcriptional regulator [Candidatus Sulfopaludibacter sp.]|nr:LuxR C-terminal-related transcriptional regulator [Candidatus Sulfopaludibacter sp.]
MAAIVLRNFPDGVWVTELASLADPALVPHSVASVLKVPDQAGRRPAETLVEALRPRSLLLVLDNCEHLQEACAGFARELLQGCAYLRILATSRTPLNVPGETLWRVPSLSLPSGDRVSVRNIEKCEAGRLFVERARAIDGAFRLTDDTAEAVERVCRRLDGMPLAIELAAARTKVLSVQQITARLDDRFRLLTGGTSALLPRHQTLRATMDWSFNLLAERERRLLRRLSVFAGGWTLEAAEFVCAGHGLEAAEILESLGRLVDNSLVLVESLHGVARCRMLETVRQYSQDRLAEAGEAESTRGRHRDWYLSYAEAANVKLRGAEEDAWRRCLETEHDNLRAALEWSKDRQDDPDAEVRLVRALEWFWYLSGHWNEGRARLEEAIGRADAASPFLPRALFGAARLAYRQGELERARAVCGRGLALCRRRDDRVDVLPLLMLSGILAMVDKNYEQATTFFAESLELARAQEDAWWASEALAFLGTVAGTQGDYDHAAAMCAESLVLSKATGSTNAITFSLRNLGLLALRRGQPGEAAGYYRDSLVRSKDAGTPGVMTECLEGLAWAASMRGDYKRAARLLAAVEKSFATLGGSQFSLYFDQAEHTRYVESTRASMDGKEFATAWNAGLAMSLDQAVEYALAVTFQTAPGEQLGGEAPAREKSAATTGPGLLTGREQQVAALVAEGLTNREIAAALVVTERTAETHVQNILNKLGVSSRAQVAAWAVLQGLKQSKPPRP